MIRKSPHSLANVPVSYNIRVGDIDLNKEYQIGSFEMFYESKSPVITGKLIINDIFDINRDVDFKTAMVNVTYIDILEGDVSLDFVIKRVEEHEHQRNQKGIVLILQDVFSYTFSKSFFSKSFFSNPTKAIVEYVDKLGLYEYELDIDELSDQYEMVIPSNVDNLTSFLKEFDKIGYCFYQTKTGIVIKKSDNLLPSILPYNGLFVDKHEEHMHGNLIHDFRIERNSRKFLKPKTIAYAFNIKTKTIDSFENNTIDDLVLNDDPFNLQEDLDLKSIYQTHLNFDDHKKKMRESFLKTNTVRITVSGYAKNDLNQIYELKLSGIKTANETIIDGNSVVNGKYVSVGVSERLMFDHITQTITLVRADESKAIKS